MNSANPENKIPSLMLRTLLSQVDQMLGHRSLIRLLRQAGLDEFADRFPPQDTTPSISVEAWSRLLADVYDIFGAGAAQAVFVQAGHLAAAEMRRQRAPQLAITGTALRLLPVDRRIRLVLEAFAGQSEETFGTPHYLYEGPDGYQVEMPDCPHCAEISRRRSAENRSLDRPFCHFAAATLAETLEWALGRRCLVEEIACIATGHATCRLGFSL
jgi:bacteriochlorophyll 4-vinyl reductase